MPPGLNVIDVRKSLFRIKLLRFIEELHILFIWLNVLAYYKKTRYKNFRNNINTLVPMFQTFKFLFYDLFGRFRISIPELNYENVDKTSVKMC